MLRCPPRNRFVGLSVGPQWDLEGVRQAASISVQNLHISLHSPKWKDRHLILDEVPPQKQSPTATLHTVYLWFSLWPFARAVGRGSEVVWLEHTGPSPRTLQGSSGEVLATNTGGLWSTISKCIALS